MEYSRIGINIYETLSLRFKCRRLFPALIISNLPSPTLFNFWTNSFSNLDKSFLQLGKIHYVIWRNTFCILEKYISIPQTCDTLTHTDVAFLAPNFDLVFIAETWINISEFVLSLILIFGISSPTDNWIIFCFEWVSSHVPQPLHTSGTYKSLWGT